MSVRKKIILVQRIFSSYRKPVYDFIAQSHEFIVLHSQNNSGIETAQASYSREIKSFKYGKGETQIYLRCLKHLIQNDANIIIHEFAIGILSLPIVFLYVKLFNKKIILWSHGYDRKKGFNPSKSYGDKYRLWCMKKADAIILYGEKDRINLSQYVDPNKIFIANNTLDTINLFALRDNLQKEGRDQVKKRLGFLTKYNLIYIGRLLPEKRPGMLIDLVEYLPNSILSECTIHIVGDGAERKKMESKVIEKGYSNLFNFHGKIHDDHLTGALLYASDLMVMPGDVGLSVNHAFCFECPVLTFESTSLGPHHGPEEAYIINWVTGFRVETHTSLSIANCISDYLINENLQHTIRNNIKIYSQKEISITKMVDGIMSCVNFVAGNE